MRKPRPQEVYRHFKGRLYQVVTLCKHSETGEEMVVYQAMYGDFAIYCRPLWMFTEALDPIRYPDAEQTNRFQLMKPMSETLRERPKLPDVPQMLREQGRREESDAAGDDMVSLESTLVPGDDAEEEEAAKRSSIMSKTIEEEAEELNLDKRVVAFLDADSTDERLKILDDLRNGITDDQIDICAMALDANIREGSTEDRFFSLRDLLLTRKRFEASRLREGKSRNRGTD
ncbi:MAG: DUF1653 domain-containing protein [Lachnospiraceae bacterium]|nr:DUF1653 domain-containing protein [Lachnospiraceae bacterium]